MWPIEKLKPHPHNARTHPHEQIEASFAKHGGVKPFVVNADGFGHGSMAALKRLGVREVPVVVVRGWTGEQGRLFMLRHNKIAAKRQLGQATARAGAGRPRATARHRFAADRVQAGRT